MSRKKAIGKECALARYSEATDGSKDDLLFVKEKIHYDDGSVVPTIKMYENYKRDFYVTKPGFRNAHQQKKEWEDVTKLNKYTTTQAHLSDDIARAIKAMPNQYLRRVCRSPYVYGADITTTSLIKDRYRKHWPDINPTFDLAVLDFETDMVHGNGEDIVSGSLTFKDRALLVVTEDFVSGILNPKDKFKELTEKYIGKHVKERNCKIEFLVVKSDKEVVVTLIERAHEWKPDIVGIWNIAYDMPRMLRVCSKYNIDPAMLFSDPAVPFKYRRFKWKQMDPKKVTASGKKTNKHPAELWHTAHHLASFYFIDLMCLYCILRIAGGKLSHYNLNTILNDEVNLGKLTFKAADNYTGVDWHVFMQSNYQIEYLVYNVFDCMGVEILDEKTKDCCQVLPVLCGLSRLTNFSSNPRRLADQLHFYCLTSGKVIGTTSDNMTLEDDELLYDMMGWIVTLSPTLRDPDSSLRIIEEDDSIRTDVYALVSDLDVRSSYPTTEVILNVSRETTRRELCRIDGISEAKQRAIGLNMTQPRVNAVELCTEALQLPSLNALLDSYKKQKR